MSYARICLNAQLHLKKIGIDNNARFRYQIGYGFRLIDASICGAKADTQFTIFDLSALEKQLPIFQQF